MRLFPYFFAVSIVAGPVALAQTGQLILRVEGISRPTGVVKACVFDQAETFLKTALRCESRALTAASSLAITFPPLPEGTYAVSVYQDENANGKLDRNQLGLPAEPFGFSRNPATLFGPPSFRKASFYLHGKQVLQITL